MSKKATSSPQIENELPRFYGAGEQVYELKVHEPIVPTSLVPESLLHDVWRKLRFKCTHLKTTQNELIDIISPGVHNLDTGPDFLNASLVINGMKWSGAIEIHVSSKEWFQHKHHLDPKYNSTILHVTLFADSHTGSLTRFDGSCIPEVVLYPLLNTPIRTLLVEKATNPDPPFPCQPVWHQVPESLKQHWAIDLGHQRISRRIQHMVNDYLHYPDFERILHIHLFSALGYDKNSDSLAELAKRIPLSISRSLTTQIQIEALHFGVAGLIPTKQERDLLSNEEAEYIHLLHTEYHALQKEFNISPMHRNSWMFFRLRPANFPTLRIAQAVSWLSPDGLLFHDPLGKLYSSIAQLPSKKELYSVLQCTPSEFWRTHYHFKKATPEQSRVLGRDRLTKLFINVVAPFLLFICEQNDNHVLEEQLITHLETLSAEKDHITRIFVKQGLQPTNSIMSQGLHELYSTYCKPLQCLHCQVGKYLISRNPNSNE